MDDLVYSYKERLVRDHLSLFWNIKYGLNFATDDEMKDLFQRYYFQWEMVFENEMMTRQEIQLKADLLKDYYNKLYETTKYEYNPIETYNRYEEYTSEGSGNSSGSAIESSTLKEDVKSKNSSYPMNTNNTKKNVSENEGKSEKTGKNNQSTTASSTSKGKGSSHIHGNIGTTTPQQLIQNEREIQLKLKMLYVEEFRSFFMFTL